MAVKGLVVLLFDLLKSGRGSCPQRVSLDPNIRIVLIVALVQLTDDHKIAVIRADSGHDLLAVFIFLVTRVLLCIETRRGNDK